MDNIFNKPIHEVIKLRHSVRSYENKSLSTEVLKQVEEYISNIENPFDIKIRIRLIESDSANKELKLGTYGVIKGANYYLVAACAKENYNFEALGYVFEKVVLYCTSLGLGTVWLGGTFNKGNFASAMEIKENEVLPIVSPLGYEGGRKSLLATMFGSNTNKRKSYGEIFFNDDFHTKLNKESSGEYYEVLEMLRLAPSAMNKQPWKVLKQNNEFHFYMDGKLEMNRIDMGIALCHFHLTAKEQKLSGEFKIIDPKIDIKYKYIISWVVKLN
ncbi:MAG: nitroreductase family protein [Clostridium sp.]|uniref:nitroreductase family protein n=1 Tax=Clostridium sp. TaxID=1506 RepID=UPI00305E5DEB